MHGDDGDGDNDSEGSGGEDCNVCVYYYTIIWGRFGAESSVSHSVLHLSTSFL